MSTCDDLDIVEGALDTGASGYVVKSDAGKELARAVEAVFRGKQFVSSSLKGYKFTGTSVREPLTAMRFSSILMTPFFWTAVLVLLLPL